MTTTRNPIESPLERESVPTRPALAGRDGDNDQRSAPEDGASRTRAPRISRDDVFEAADSLLLEGVRPTIDRVRMRLGRGSPNTINDHLDVWWAKLGSRLRDLPGHEFPQLPETVARSLQGLWNEALRASHEVLQGSLRTRQDALQADEQLLESQRMALAHDQVAMEGRSAALQEALIVAKEQLEHANQRARVLEAALGKRDAELAQTRGEHVRLTEDLERVQSKRDSDRAAATQERARLVSRHEATETRWLNEVDRGRQALKQAETRLREQQVRLNAVTVERDRLVKERLKRTTVPPSPAPRARPGTRKTARKATRKAKSTPR